MAEEDVMEKVIVLNPVIKIRERGVGSNEEIWNLSGSSCYASNVDGNSLCSCRLA